ncbi:bifunctional 3,4-dihydroxy-2-butanone-4-phosphate synthase/GTP cyclohydrolase II [Nitrospinae bacterium AH_259_B05_G02_I21]|nr:bifunctional 3,4-dihydroxy-2-butanone-4-phosphate synthase/GTP cyclohydrolase II [Nitrospinae bacterium AH_259_B05_G02_I21]MDA2931548.1 bifunctional 3,4-dihydroxy-2-butanone-4-phosphate synthase/GTP cyclohydrolase II [Nitrospinae bacterium AH-259-F20]
MPFHPIEEVLEDIRQGEMIVLVDDEDRENEGDLVVAAAKSTPDAINFMIKNGGGLICLALTPQRVEELKLPAMVEDNSSRYGTAFTVSIGAREGVTTGISASDRCRTILTAIDLGTSPQDLTRPGHVFPLRAREGGVLIRAGHTEGAVDLARLSGLFPAGAICEILNEDGTMARLPELERFAAEHGLKMCSIKDLIAYRMRTESFVSVAASTTIPTDWGEFKAVAFKNTLSDDTHVAFVQGEVDPETPMLVRVHSQCLTGDVFGSHRCDCGDQLLAALQMIAEAGSGVLLYLQQEGRGIGLLNKLKSYELQDEGLDTVEANETLGFKDDLRDYGIGAQILVALGLRKIRLLTNNPRKIVGLAGYGLEVVEREPLVVEPRETNIRYLAAKRQKLGHLIENL